MWQHFAAMPLLWILVTVAVYLAAGWLNQRCGRTPLLHPVIVSLSLIILLLKLTEIDYATYIEGAAFIKFLMGPAIVALAIPLYDNLHRVREMLLPLLIGCVVGALVAALSAVGIGWLLGADVTTLLSLAPKSVTSPIAIEVADKIGGYGSLAAGLVLITGALGCLMAPLLFKLLRIDDPAIRGFTLGVSAHAMGTAFAFEYGALAGAFSGLAMGMVGTFTAFVLPLLVEMIALTG
ncbi:LrgB family protein [Marinobacterium arenosum]|uniref:LrgB family protein n=1 Tax=Marinobacterium arenosum TaxID=2862496 RepID=UPI001C97A23E|nr:LrgB family protein [Marinobacterium arenosum]MBY4676621.1 LrgB family protein [Marinobacterium arenosum]